MSVLNFTGFEVGPLTPPQIGFEGDEAIELHDATVSAVTPITGEYSLLVTPGTKFALLYSWTRPDGALDVMATDTLYVEFKVKFDAPFDLGSTLGDYNGEIMLTLYHSISSVIGHLIVGTDLKVRFKDNGGAGVVQSSAAAVFTAGQVHTVGVYMDRDVGAGSTLWCWVDGVLKLDLQAIGRDFPFSTVALGCSDAQSQNGYTARYDDVAMFDVEPEVVEPIALNVPKMVKLLRVVADGTVNEWTPQGGGTAFSKVDDVPPQIVTYVTTATDAKRQLFTVEGYEDREIGGGIIAVMPIISGYKSTDGSAAPSLKLLAKSVATEVTTASALDTFEDFYRTVALVVEDDPATAADWDVDNPPAQVGAISVGAVGGQEVRMAFAGLMVLYTEEFVESLGNGIRWRGRGTSHPRGRGSR